MQYINHETHSLYSGARAHWRDIPVTSDQPSPHHRPVVEAGAHVAWEVDAADMTEALRQSVQAHIDSKAQSRGYENGFTLAGYVASTVPEWQAEAVAFVGWRDACWLFVFDWLDNIKAGEAEPPASADDLIDALPKIEWTV